MAGSTLAVKRSAPAPRVVTPEPVRAPASLDNQQRWSRTPNRDATAEKATADVPTTDAGKPRAEKIPPIAKAVQDRMVADVEHMVRLLKAGASSGGDQIELIAPFTRYAELDERAPIVDGARTTPHVDRFLIMLKSRVFTRSGIRSLFQDQWSILYDTLWYDLRGQYLERFKRIVAGSRTQRTEGPESADRESGVALIAKQEAMGMWGMIKGMSTTLVGIAGPAAANALAECFDETGDILFGHEWTAAEPLVWGMNAGQIGSAGGDIIGQLILLGRGAGSAKAAKIFALVDKLQRILGVAGGLQGVAFAAKGLADLIAAKQAAGKKLTWEELSNDPVFLDQLVGLASSVVGTVLAAKAPPATGKDMLARARIHALLKTAQISASATGLITTAASDLPDAEKEREYGRILTSLIPLLFSAGVDVHQNKGLGKQAAQLDAQKKQADLEAATQKGLPPARDDGEPPALTTTKSDVDKVTAKARPQQEPVDEKAAPLPAPKQQAPADDDAGGKTMTGSGKDARQKRQAALDAAEQKMAEQHQKLMEKQVEKLLGPRDVPQTPEEVRSGKRAPRYSVGKRGSTTVAEGVKSLASARKLYDDVIAETQGKHEVGIWQNEADGTYTVRLGQATSVSEPDGRVRPVQHYHTNAPDIAIWRMPARADIADTLNKVGNRKIPITEIVEHPLPGGKRGQVAYTVHPNGTIDIVIVGEGGKPLKKSYKNLADFEERESSKTVMFDPALHPEIDASMLADAKKAARAKAAEDKGKTMVGPAPVKPPAEEAPAALSAKEQAKAEKRAAAETKKAEKQKAREDKKAALEAKKAAAVGKKAANAGAQGRAAAKLENVELEAQRQAASKAGQERSRAETRARLEASKAANGGKLLSQPAELDADLPKLKQRPDPDERLALVEELLARPGLSDEARAYLEQQKLIWELQASVEAAPSATKQLEGAESLVSRAKAAYARASATVETLIRKKGENYREKLKAKFDQILGEKEWARQQAARPAPLGLAVDHLIPVATILELPQMKAFLKVFAGVPDHRQGPFLERIERLGDIEINLVAMNAKANGSGLKSAKHWEEITFDQAKKFGYDPEHVQEMRKQADDAMKAITDELDLMTLEAQAAAAPTVKAR